VLKVHPFTASPETPVLGVQTKVSYPPKLLLIVTTSEGSPEHEVTLSVDNSNAGLGSTETLTSYTGDAQPKSPTKIVLGRVVLVVPYIDPAGVVAAKDRKSVV